MFRSCFDAVAINNSSDSPVEKNATVFEFRCEIPLLLWEMLVNYLSIELVLLRMITRNVSTALSSALIWNS